LIEIEQSQRQKRQWYFLGILPGAWAIVGSRWGSYLPSEPIFFSDLFIALLIISSIFSKSRVKRSVRFSLFVFLIFFLSFQLLIADWNQPITTLRDFMPYFYLAVAPIMALRFISANDEVQEAFGKVLEFCLVLHTLWCLSSFFIPKFSESLPLVNAAQGLHFFSIRPDFDASITSVFIAMVILGRINLISRKFQYFLIFFSIIYIFSQNNRASFISFAILLVIAIQGRLKLVRNIDQRAFMKLVVVTAFLISIIFIGQLSIGQKFLGTLNANSNNISAQAGAGTASARLEAWKNVFNYSNSNPRRIAIGSGFGTDYLQDSGALRAMVNSEAGSRTNPRHPHNYWINSYARLGLTGFLLIGLIIFSGLRMALKICKNPFGYRNATLFSALLLIGVIPIASLGVVLESPFGAIAMSMTLGFMLAEMNREKAS
jgi:O-antigen ligase